MDTSETYIRMHLALPEPMRQEPGEGDYFYDTKTGETGGRVGEVYFSTTYMIKLYEQDQLQEMVCFDGLNEFDSLLSMEGSFSDFILRLGQNPIRGWKPTSMEQLWLAFYMKEKYGKIWDGDGWK